jgi:hypothetical protein
MPTNIVLDAIHTRRGLKWGLPAMFLACSYVLAMLVCIGSAETGESGWLNVLALLFAWNSLEFVIAGLATLIGLIQVRGREAQSRRQEIRAMRERLDGLVFPSKRRS